MLRRLITPENTGAGANEGLFLYTWRAEHLRCPFLSEAECLTNSCLITWNGQEAFGVYVSTPLTQGRKSTPNTSHVRRLLMDGFMHRL